MAVGDGRYCEPRRDPVDVRVGHQARSGRTDYGLTGGAADGRRAGVVCPVVLRRSWLGDTAGVDAGFGEIALSELIGALSCALDIAEGEPPGHAARSCLIGMRVAD